MNALEPADGKIEITWGTVAKVPIVILGCYLLYLLIPLAMLLFVSILLAVTYEPVVVHLSRLVGRKGAIALIALFNATVFIGLGLLVVPELIAQLTAFYQKIPDFLNDVADRVPQLAGLIRHLPQKFQSADPTTISPILNHAARIGMIALSTLSSIVLIFAFMVYLLLDGARVYAWGLAFFDHYTRVKIDHTCTGIAPVISAYVIGQVVTSTLCSVFTYVVLWWLGVPAALVLAVLAGIFDVLPIIGFFLFAIPATLFALTVSTQAALITFICFGAYHLIEAYLISPLVYGNRLRVSGLVVLSTLIAGGAVGGIMGAIAILPIVASYPVIEKIWLAKLLGREVIQEHKHLAEDE